MAGTKASGRPGGNPDIKEYGFKTTRKEPLSEQVNIRLGKSMSTKLKALDNWQEIVRKAIEEKLNQIEEAN
jgi:hypothetical protein